MGSRVARWSVVLLLAPAAAPAAELRRQSFDRDPGWEGRANRAVEPARRTIRQDFGYSPTRHAGGRKPGEMGGFITPAGEPAYYARRIAARTLDDPLTASGTLACSGREFHVLLGFFRAGSLDGWRTPNTVALRLYGRGDVFYAYVEYATSKWRAGGDSPRGFSEPDAATGRERPIGFASRGAAHRWSLSYDPVGGGGVGAITATIDDRTAVCDLPAEHRADGITVDRFGLMNVIKHADGGGELWVDDVAVNGETERFDRDPAWDHRGNRRTYETADVRPRFDFGYSATRHAGGRIGEMGGLVFRGDGRAADRIAWYADRLPPLGPDTTLMAEGRVCLRRGISDSGTLLGFFNAADGARVSEDPRSGLPDGFVGLAIEGPSSEGFFVYPAFRLAGDVESRGRGPDPPRIVPDGRSHRWTLRYEPPAAGRAGRITVTLDGHANVLEVPALARPPSAPVDRFGLITTRIDGNGQVVYFDDLRYTAGP